MAVGIGGSPFGDGYGGWPAAEEVKLSPLPREPPGSQPAFSTSSAQLCKSMRGRTTVYPLFTLPTSRLVDCAGFDPAPHFLDRQDAPRRLRVHDLFAGVIASYFGPAVDRVRLA